MASEGRECAAAKPAITPEMIEAGVAVLRDYDDFVDLGPTLEEVLVRRILETALEASQVMLFAESRCQREAG